jgi:hypothetical protein
MKYYLLIWLSNQLYFVDTYSSMDECLQQGHLLLQKQNQYEFQCNPNAYNATSLTTKKFDKSMLESEKKNDANK